MYPGGSHLFFSTQGRHAIYSNIKKEVSSVSIFIMAIHITQCGKTPIHYKYELIILHIHTLKAIIKIMTYYSNLYKETKVHEKLINW